MDTNKRYAEERGYRRSEEPHVEAPAWTVHVIGEFHAADHRAQQLLIGLNQKQLNWQPRPGAWSVGQCLEHLCLTNEAYLPAMSRALEGKPVSAAQEITLGWFSRWFINNFVEPSPQSKRVPAPKNIVPANQIGASVLDRFLRSSQAARELIRRASNYDVNHVRFRSPFAPLFRLTVGTGLEIVSSHERRHLLQAERVKQSSGFPS